MPIYLTVLLLFSTQTFAQPSLPSERELNRRIQAHAVQARVQDRERMEEIARAGDEDLQRNEGRTYWSEDRVAALRRLLGRDVTAVWSQAKKSKSGRWIKGSGGDISYSDAGVFCKFMVPASGAWFAAHQDCYDMNGSPLGSL